MKWILAYWVLKELYKKRRFTPKLESEVTEYDYGIFEEGNTFFGVESYRDYESVYPGTVTVEGFGLEAWHYQNKYHRRQTAVSVYPGDVPLLNIQTLLRRMDELQNQDPGFGMSANPKQDFLDLKEFTGDLG